ncbi:MAG: hypothetical protein JWR21_2464 [Herminiimonas sp.]|nr:hypothetical protein [Herminiimonas sp.]MDB5852243.1 hypothetical protein [Herminiimonas sp.]
MSHTVIAVFDNFDDADTARDALIGSGIPIADVQLTPSEDTLTSRQSTLVRSGHHVYDVDSGWSFSGLLSQLFGADESSVHPDLFSEAIRRGSYLLAVEAETDLERDRAVDIVNRFNPVDLDERATQWRQGGWTGYDHAAPVLGPEDAANDRDGYKGVSADRAERRGAHSFRRQQAEVSGQGGKNFPPAGANEAHYRRHWASSRGESDDRYEDHEAAYAHGEKLGANNAYKGYAWNQIEPEAQLQWESNNSGTPWDRARDAVRFAWERSTK